MQPDRPVSLNGRAAPRAEHASLVSQIDWLRDTCRRQAVALVKQSDVIAVLRSGGRALKAENADLRGEVARLRNAQAAPLPVDDPRARMAEARLARGVGAPGAARAIVTDCLGDRVSPTVLANAQLLISELVGNSVRHSDAPGHAVIVRVGLERAMCRLEVEDAGSAGEVMRRAPDLKDGGGLGLHIVQELSERWGVERAARGGTRVWAYLRRAPHRTHAHGRDAEAVTRVATAT